MGLSEVEYEVACREAMWSARGVGRVAFWQLLGHFGSGKAAWEAKDKLISEVGLSNTAKTAFLKRRDEVDIGRRHEMLKKMKVSVRALGVGVEMEGNVIVGYPSTLAAIQDPPPILYVKGTIFDHDQNSLAVIGTRRPTDYGIKITQMLVNDLCSSGITIVSGMARGIDGVGHRAALIAGGRTIAVLGGGIDQVFPVENGDLYLEIPKRGAVISMFWPGERGLKGHFVQRNRLVSGLSLGVLVTEAAAKSGTQITVNYAIEQNKHVFAVPGKLTSAMSDGPVRLIKQGAHMVTEANDILKVLDIDGLKVGKNGFLTKRTRDAFSEELHWQIYERLQRSECEVDVLARELKVGMDELNTALTMLEMEGVVKAVGRQWGVN